jgi:hypothetical protein
VTFESGEHDLMAPAVTKLKRPVTAYLRENIH